MTTDAQNLAQLQQIADDFHFTASRVGERGCQVRLKAADNEAVVRWAIERLKSQRASINAEVGGSIGKLRNAGFGSEADLLETVFSAWMRTVGAYRHALPYVDDHPDGFTAEGTLSVVTYTIKHWSALIPGTPTLDNEAVRREGAQDDAWHRDEDRRMRREAGEDIP